MAELDGPTFCRELKRRRPELLPRVVFLSARKEDQAADELPDDGPLHRVLKPFSRDEISA
jgi:CheY-like chemotaxis protein